MFSATVKPVPSPQGGMLNVKPASLTWMNRSRVDCSSGGPHQKPVEKADLEPAGGPEATTRPPTTSATTARIVQPRLAPTLML